MGSQERIASEIKQAHDRVAGTYGGYKKGKIGNFDKRIECIFDMILSRCSLTSEKSICLDIGCGNGQFTEMLAQKGFSELIGADFSKQMITFARDRAEYCGYKERVALVQTSAMDLPFTDNAFDLIFMYGVIEHLDSAERVLGELLGTTKRQGLMILDIPQKNSLCYYTYILFGQSTKFWGTASGRFSIKFADKKKYYKFYSTNEIVDWLERHGDFEVIARIPTSYSHMVGPFGFMLNRVKKKLGKRFERATEKVTKKVIRVPSGEIVAIKKL